MLAGDDLASMDPVGPDFVHLVTEALKRAFADRESYYGDTALHDIPVDTLLSEAHNAAHRADIGQTASHDHRPGRIAGFEALADAFLARAARRTPEAGVGAGEPTMAHLVNQRGDTVHVDVVDPLGQHGVGHALGRLAEVEPGRAGAGCAVEHAGADVLAGRGAADDAGARGRGPERRSAPPWRSVRTGRGAPSEPLAAISRTNGRRPSFCA